MRLVPGKDFEIVTVSFDPREGPELAESQEGELRQVAGQARGRRRLAFPDQRRRVGGQDAGRRHRLRLQAGPEGRAVPAPIGHLHLHARRPRGPDHSGRGVRFRRARATRWSTPRRERSARGCSAWPCPAGWSITIRRRGSTPGPPWRSCASRAS